MSRIDKSRWYDPPGRAVYTQTGWERLSDNKPEPISCTSVIFTWLPIILILLAIVLVASGYF